MKEQGTIRLADRIAAGREIKVMQGADDSEDANNAIETIRSQIYRVPLIVADNCAEYVSEREVLKFGTDIPNAMPPFSASFIEYRTQKEAQSEISYNIAKMSCLPDRVGCWVQSKPLSDWEEAWRTSSKKGEAYNRILKLRHDGVNMEKSKVVLCVAVGAERDTLHFLGTSSLAVLPDGRIDGGYIYTEPHMWHDSWAEPLNKLCRSSFTPAEMRKQQASQVLRYVLPALITISFMHCRNVRMLHQEPSQKLSKAFQRRHGRPLLRYHTLEIEPMKKVLETEGGIAQNGLKKALHICRGHFATLTRNNKGEILPEPTTYFREAHVRGAANEGVVAKDYRVKVPAGMVS